MRVHTCEEKFIEDIDKFNKDNCQSKREMKKWMHTYLWNSFFKESLGGVDIEDSLLVKSFGWPVKQREHNHGKKQSKRGFWPI